MKEPYIKRTFRYKCLESFIYRFKNLRFEFIKDLVYDFPDEEYLLGPEADKSLKDKFQFVETHEEQFTL